MQSPQTGRTAHAQFLGCSGTNKQKGQTKGQMIILKKGFGLTIPKDLVIVLHLNFE